MDKMNDSILGDRAGWHGTLAGASSGMLFKMHKLLVSGIFPLNSFGLQLTQSK